MKMRDQSQDREACTKIFCCVDTQSTKDIDGQEPSKHGCFNWEVQ